MRKVYFAVHNREVYKNVMDNMKKIDLEKIVKNVSTENEQEIIGKIQEVANSDTQVYSVVCRLAARSLLTDNHI